MFDEILVIDYIASYADLTDEQKTDLNDKIVNNKFLINCPNGTIVGTPISAGQVSQPRVYYPFFSHLRVPIKAGERAWACTPNPSGVSYWLSRKVQNTSAEDPNFTHDDRAFTATQLSPVANSTNFVDAGRSGVSLKQVRQEAISRSQFSGKPTVSVKGKSPDLSLQGSNGTAVVMTDYTGEGVILIKAGLSDDKQAELSAVENTDGYRETVKPYSTRSTQSDTSVIEVSSTLGVSIRVGDAIIEVLANGDIVITPSPTGVIKLGGSDADKAIVCQRAAEATPGNVAAPSIVTTAGGLIAAPGIDGTGFFASKVLVK